MFRSINDKRVIFDIYDPNTNLPLKKLEILLLITSVYPKRFFLNENCIIASKKRKEIKKKKIIEKFRIKFLTLLIR